MTTTANDDTAIQPDLRIEFVREDFDQILRDNGVDPDTVTVDEWRKFTDAFLDGTAWSEVAGYAVDAIKARRS